MTKRLEYPKFQTGDSNNNPLSGGFVYTYAAGTTTLKTTYSDYDASTENDNPVELDSRGEADIYLQGSYKIVLKDSALATIWTLDNVQGGVGADAAMEDYYYPDATATDQGVTGSSDTIKYAVDTISTDNGTIYLKHDGGTATTTYTLTTSESPPINVNFIIESGAILDGAGTLTLDNPEQISAGLRQQIFGGSITIKFTNSGTVYPQWWDDDAGDGSTDCATAVQSAVDSIVTDADFIKVKMIAGDYVISSAIDLASNLWIQGDGEGTYLDFSALGVTEHAFQFDEGSNPLDDCRISDLKISGPEGDYDDGGAGIFINSSHHERFRAENLRIANFSYGISIDGQTTGEGPHVINCWIDHNSYAGIKIQDSQNSLITGNTIDGERAGVGSELDGKVGIWHTSEGGGFGNLYNRIIGNTVKNTTTEGILIRGKHASVVGNTVHDGVRGIVVEPFSGNTPDADDGRMYVTVTGNTVETMTVDGITISTDAVNITQGVSGCVVSGNTVFNIGKTTVDSTGIRIGSSVDSPAGENNIVMGNFIRDCYQGISARDTNNIQLIGNIVDDSHAYGIRVQECEGASIIGGSVSTDGATPGYGIYVSGGKDVLIQGVSVIDVDVYGMHIQDSADKVFVTNCRISDQKTIPTMTRGINLNANVTNFVHKDNIIEGYSVAAIYNYQFLAAAPALPIWGVSVLNGGSNQIDATLADGVEIGTIKTIVLEEATNQPHTVTIASHVTEDNEVATFDAVDETLVLMWTGTEWVTIYATATF